jgi:hypothetical protein
METPGIPSTTREPKMEMQSSSARLRASRRTAIQLAPARTRGRAPALIGVMVLLTGITQLYAQNRTATGSLVLQVRPEERLEDQNGIVALKIRLAGGTTARLWAADSCTSPSPQSQVITMSGIYSIPHSALTPVINNPGSGTMRVCLASSDGLLNDSLPVDILGMGTGTAAQGATPQISPSGLSVDVPAGWVLTTQAGQATWSSP